MSSHVYILSWSLYCVCPALRNIWNLRSSLFTPKPQIFVCWLFVLMEHCWHIYCLQICHTEWNMHHKCETNGTMPCSFWPAHRGVSLKEHCHTQSHSSEFWVLSTWLNVPDVKSRIRGIRINHKMQQTCYNVLKYRLLMNFKQNAFLNEIIQTVINSWIW